MLTDKDRNDYRHRIKLVRKLHNCNQIKFAKLLGIPYKRWNHYECGYWLTRESAFTLLLHVKGLSFDWLYLGNEKAMDQTLLRRLKHIEREERKADKGNAKRKAKGLPKARKRMSKTSKNQETTQRT